MLKLEAEINKVLNDEAEATINLISSNIFKNGITHSGINRTGTNISGGKTGQNASGKTIQSIKKTVKDNSLLITGREKFSELETGTRPNSGVTVDAIYQWSKYKGLPFQNDNKRFWFSKYAANKINKDGSLLFRMGGRKDVYTNEVQPLIARIFKGIDKVFYDIKLIE